MSMAGDTRRAEIWRIAAAATLAVWPVPAAAEDAPPRLGPGQAAVAGSLPPAGAGRPGYKLLRYDEDWSGLADPAARADLWDALKYVPLGGGGRRYLSLGGEVREWFESFHNDSFGLGPGNARGYDTAFLQRYHLHADLHLGESFRAFAQTVNGFEDGRAGGPRPDIDRNRFDAHQAFLDWRQPLGGEDSFTWRLGRQEFEYGTGRLIDVREGPNLRLAFDAARFLAKAGGWSLDGWWGRPVRNNPGTLDDDPNPRQSLWGVYGARPVGDGSSLNFDPYYLGYENRRAAYDQGEGRELRHSVGTRVWGKPGNWEHNLEYVGPFGTFAGGRVAAWTAANAARYTFAGPPLKPRPGLRFDVASGDRDPASGTLNTFYPLFPAGSYFNLTGPVGPQNIIDLHPTLDLTLSETATPSADWNFFWRASTADGVYRLLGSLLASGRAGGARYVGSSPAVAAVWHPTRHVTLLAGYVHVFPGDFLREATPGKPIDFATTWLSYKF